MENLALQTLTLKEFSNMKPEEMKQRLTQMQELKTQMRKLGVTDELVLDRIFMAAGEHSVKAVEWAKMALCDMRRLMQEGYKPYGFLDYRDHSVAARIVLRGVLSGGIISTYRLPHNGNTIEQMRRINGILAKGKITRPTTEIPDIHASIIRGAEIALRHLAFEE